MTTGIEFYFDPSRKGIAVFMGPAQARLMELCWKHGRLTAQKAIIEIGKKKSPLYGTVNIGLVYLLKKGLLKRAKKGRFFYYSPTIERKKFIRNRVLIIEKCLKANFGKI